MSRSFLVPILLPADPAVSMEAATKQYVDNTRTSAGRIFYLTNDASDIATYYKALDAPSAGAQATFTATVSGTTDFLLAAWATEPGVPGVLVYPAGTAYRRIYCNLAGGNVARLHMQIYVRDLAGTETLARDEFSPNFSNTTVALNEWLISAASAGAMATTDRIVCKLYAQRVSGAGSFLVTMYVEGTTNASHIQTTIIGGTTGTSAYVAKSGDTMTGPLVLPADPTLALQAATKQYVDSKAGGISNVFELMWSNSTTEPPTGSEVRINNATPSAATKVWLRYTTVDNVDIKNRFLVQAKLGNQLYLQDKDDSTHWYLYDITADATDDGTYADIPVTWDSGAGTIPAQRVLAAVITPVSTGGGTASGTKLSALAAITGALLATLDLIEVVDVSDTSMAASGTNKKITLAELVNYLNTVVSPTGMATTAYVDARSNSGPLFNYAFSTTTSAGPAASTLRLNNATPASATIVYVHYTSLTGVDVKVRLLAATAGDRLFIQDRDASANYRVYELTGAPTDNTTYASVPVVHRTGGGTLADNEPIVAGFTTPPITVGTSAPSSPLTNDLWIDTT